MFSSDRRRLRGARAQRWFRWLHSYTSMISLLIVLFFGATGITLNHPTWTLGDHADHTAASGTLPVGFAPSGIVDFLAVSEYARATYGITAEVSDYGADPAQGHISYAGPGYAASIVFDVATGAYTVDVEQQGFVAVLNDLHKGRSTNGSWNWTIDLAGGLLVVVAVTGLGIQLFLRKRRGRLLGIAAAGAVLVCIVGYLTLA
ncbi:MAG: peptidase [Ilumatobacteraceae bacterium]|nr:peptidase [Ilumatobacteraceae bacterium]